MNLARSPLLVGPRRKKTDRGQRSDTSRFVHLTFAHRVSALLLWLVKDRAAFRARRIWSVLTQKPGLSATEPLASRVPPPFRGHQIKGAVYTVCFFIKSWMFLELFLFAKKMKFLTRARFVVLPVLTLVLLFYARTTASRRAPNWS